MMGSNLILNRVNKNHSGHYKCVERMDRNNSLTSYTLIVETTNNTHTSKGYSLHEIVMSMLL